MRRASLLFALTLGACPAKMPTELVVVVDSDLDVPSEAAGVTIEVRGATSGAVRGIDAGLGATAAHLPATLGVEATDPSEPVTITVTLRDRTGAPIVSRQASTGFTSGESRMIELMLCRRCADAKCAPGETCTELGCRPATVAASELPAWTGTIPARPGCFGAAPPAEAGVPDDALDAGATDAPEAPVGDPGTCLTTAVHLDRNNEGIVDADTCDGPPYMNRCDGSAPMQGAIFTTARDPGLDYHITVDDPEAFVLAVDDKCLVVEGPYCPAEAGIDKNVPAGMSIVIGYLGRSCGGITFHYKGSRAP